MNPEAKDNPTPLISGKTGRADPANPFDAPGENLLDILSVEPEEVESIVERIAMSPWIADGDLDRAMDFLRPLGEIVLSYQKARTWAIRAPRSPQPLAMFKKAAGEFKRLLALTDAGMTGVLTANVQNSLGNALAGLGERVGGGESIAYLRESAEAFRSGLELASYHREFGLWAKISSNLGLVLASLGGAPDGGGGASSA